VISSSVSFTGSRRVCIGFLLRFSCLLVPLFLLFALGLAPGFHGLHFGLHLFGSPPQALDWTIVQAHLTWPDENVSPARLDPRDYQLERFPTSEDPTVFHFARNVGLGLRPFFAREFGNAFLADADLLTDVDYPPHG
jgi:hypothetical protein